MAQFATTPEFREIARNSARFNRALAQEMERATAQWLHMWNLPAASDVRKLRRQVKSVDREVRQIRQLLERMDGGVSPEERAELDRMIRQFQADLDAAALPGDDVDLTEIGE